MKRVLKQSVEIHYQRDSTQIMVMIQSNKREMLPRTSITSMTKIGKKYRLYCANYLLLERVQNQKHDDSLKVFILRTGAQWREPPR